MARYGNPVLEQLQLIGRTTERGMEKMGNVPLDIANLNINRAKLEAEIQNRASDLSLRRDQLTEMIAMHKATQAGAAETRAETARANLAREAGAAESRAEARKTSVIQRKLQEPALEATERHMERLDRDVTIPELSGGNTYRIGHWLATGSREDDQDTMIDELAKAFGGEYMAQGKNKGKIVLKNGKTLKMRDLDKYPEKVQAIILGNMSPDRAVQDLRDQIEEAQEKGEIDPQLQQTFEEKLQRIKEFQDDPQARITALQNQINQLEILGGPGMKKAVARTQAKIDEIKGAESQKAEQAFELKKIQKKESAKAKAEGLSTLGKEARDIAAMSEGAITEKEAIQGLQKDRRAGRIFTAYAAAVKSLPMEIEMDPELYPQKIAELREQYGIDELLEPLPFDKKEPTDDPDNIRELLFK